MANSSTSKKKNTNKSPKKTSTRAAKTALREPEPPPPPIRRELAGGIFFFAGLFLIIGYFINEGAVIVFISRMIKSLLGYGYYLTAPVFLLLAAILIFHKGKPVALRVFSVLMLPLLFGAIGQLFLTEPLQGAFEIRSAVEQLYADGQALLSGGVLGGLLGIALETAFNRIGAFILLVILFLVFLVIGLRLDFVAIFARMKERVSIPYEEEEPVFVTEKPVNAAPRKAKEPKSAPVPARSVRSASRMDIPLGEEEDLLPLREFDEGHDTAQEPKRARVRKKSSPPPVQTINPTERIDPMDIDEAAAIAGVALQKERRPVTAPVRETPVISTEIADPPRGKKLGKNELKAEVDAVSSAIEANGDAPSYLFPPLDLLRGGTNANVDYRDEVRVNRERLENALHSFGISSAISGVTRGPTVTRYDIELEQGVKLSRVTNLSGDLALALGVENVRIAPIPEKISTVGIEVPNKMVSTVYLRDILEAPKFATAKSKISFAIGKDISGDAIVGNIAKLPHLLIAGTTGSGKSVCMNSLILSLLYKARPDEVRLIMIDPKMVELGIYNGIPHLYVPVVTDPKKAAGALQWSVVEMLKRYRLFSEVGVRDLENYNRHCASQGEATLPQVVIVIDELADLMMVAAKEVEESICRVAQMGRAAGMHLVIATQRPSADIITGLMKANVPSRIAFAVSSAMESRIILDQSGAEKLIGAGDMLFSPVGVGKPVRIQGAFVSDEERESVVQFIKDNTSGAQMNADIEDYMNKAAEEKSGGSDGGKGSADESGGLGDYDEMLPQAVEAVLEAKSCSVSMLQRRVKLGYSRAARIVDQMEELGIVGPYEGAKPRSVVIDRAGWEELRAQLGMGGNADLALAAEMNEDEDY